MFVRESYGVVVSALCCDWKNPSSSPPIDFEFGNKCYCNLSDYNHASFPLVALGLYGGRFVES